MELLGDDTATEILSRLPAKSLLAFKCTAKRWYNFLSNPLFLSIHYETAKETPVLLVQDIHNDLFTLTENEKETRSPLKSYVLDFLPERVVITSASNGILCCRSLDYHNLGYAIYICNPVTRKWLQLKSKGHYKSTINHLGLAFYPLCSSSGSTSMFKLVNIKRSTRDNPPYTYLFDIYSSDTKKWKTSKEVCTLRSSIDNLIFGSSSINDQYKAIFKNFDQNKAIFTNGWLHWLTKDKQLITFHVENECCKVINMSFAQGIFWDCLGVSEGYFHYVCVKTSDGNELEVWILKSYEEPTWILKHSLNIDELCKQNSIVVPWEDCMWMPLAFYEDVVYIHALERENAILISYNLRRKRIINNCAFSQRNLWFSAVFSHRNSLVPFRACRVKRDRKRKLLEE